LTEIRSASSSTFKRLICKKRFQQTYKR